MTNIMLSSMRLCPISRTLMPQQFEIQNLTLHKVYNLENNSPVSLMEFIETIEKKMGKNDK